MKGTFMKTYSSFIQEEHIQRLLTETTPPTDDAISSIVDKALLSKGLDLEEVATLLRVDTPTHWTKIFQAAKKIKESIYGNRIVMFAPLYISNYCTNGCLYCGYKHSNAMHRKKLTDEELIQEAQEIIKMGHKRIVLEAGEDDINCPVDYVIHAMNVLYDSHQGETSLRRINVNIAATTVENYQRLKAANIGTYTLFQETYHEATYKKYHPLGAKSNYVYHITAMDRAMEGGIDDVGLGALFGLYDFRFEVLALMQHKDHLEKTFGVGPHTISVPRIRKANNVDVNAMPYAVTDDDFKKIVAIIRLAVPYTGIILSTREKAAFRDEVIDLGVSQISAGSKTDVGGYHEEERIENQFELADERPHHVIIKSLLKKGYIPSYCTACYRTGRTGDRFMQVAKTGEIQNLCHPNALMTLKEYLEDYCDDDLKTLGNQIITDNISKIPNEKMRRNTVERLQRISNGERDLYF